MALVAPFNVIVDTPDYWRGTLVDSPALVAGTVTAPASINWNVIVDKFAEFFSADDFKVQAAHLVGPHPPEAAPNLSILRVNLFNVVPGTTDVTVTDDRDHGSHDDFMLVTYRPLMLRGAPAPGFAEVEVVVKHVTSGFIYPVAYLRSDFRLTKQGHSDFTGTGYWTYLSVDPDGTVSHLQPKPGGYVHRCGQAPEVTMDRNGNVLMASEGEGFAAVARWETGGAGRYSVAGDATGHGNLEIRLNGQPVFKESLAEKEHVFDLMLTIEDKGAIDVVVTEGSARVAMLVSSITETKQEQTQPHGRGCQD